MVPSRTCWKGWRKEETASRRSSRVPKAKRRVNIGALYDRFFGKLILWISLPKRVPKLMV